MQLKAAYYGTFFHNFALVRKTHALLQGFFKCGSRVVHNFFN